jgi:hypothetical protein
VQAVLRPTGALFFDCNDVREVQLFEKYSERYRERYS